MARFEREARILAALNHPHIGAIYGLEDVDGIRALVLELVEGKTLAERLAEARPSMPAALTIARDIAAALEAAHEKGVIHRDLKPANIKITPDGAVKVLDFGLAKVFASDDPAADPSRLPGLTFEDREGVIAGTAGYMSPEQARGAAVNKRADIWAFGCVVYEMLAGRPAFSGETRADITAWILERDPDWSALPADTPATVRRLLHRCLERDAARRLRDIGDARLEIDETLSASGASLLAADLRPAAVPAIAPVTRKPILWWAAAGGDPRSAAPRMAIWYAERHEFFWRDPFEGATFTTVDGFRGRRTARRHLAQRTVRRVHCRSGGTRCLGRLGPPDRRDCPLSYNLTNGRLPELRNPATRTVGFIPDGTQVVLWSRRTDSNEGGGLVDAGSTVPTLGGPIQPFLKMKERISELDFSPDGKRIVYHPPTGGDPLFVIAAGEKAATPGPPILVGQPGQHNHYPVWSPDAAFIYFVKGPPLEKSDVWRIPSAGGAPERITRHDSAVSFPTLLDDRTLLYLATDEDGYGPWIYAMDVERRVPHRISRGLEEYTSLAASADGLRLVATLVRSTSSSLWRLPIADRPVTASGVSPMIQPTANRASPQVGPGFFTYRAPRAGRDAIWKVTGGESAEVWNGSEGRAVSGAVVTRDGTHLAVVVRQRGQLRLWVMNADGSGARPISGEYQVRGAPAWSPDGRWVAAGVSHESGQVHLYKFPVAVDGGPPQPLVTSRYATDPAWSPSGEFLVYTDADVGTNFNVLAVNADGTPRPIPALKLKLTRGARRLVFRGEHELVFMDGNISYRDFWLLDLLNGAEAAVERPEIRDSGFRHFHRWPRNLFRSLEGGVRHRAHRAPGPRRTLKALGEGRGSRGTARSVGRRPSLLDRRCRGPRGGALSRPQGCRARAHGVRRTRGSGRC